MFVAEKVLLLLVISLTAEQSWVNNRGAGDMRRHRAHYDATVILCKFIPQFTMDVGTDPCCDKRSTNVIETDPGGRLNKKDGLTRCGNSHVKDKTS